MNQSNKSNKSNKKIVRSLMSLVTLSFMVFLVACGGTNDELVGSQLVDNELVGSELVDNELVDSELVDSELVGRWVFEVDPSWVTTFDADGSGTHAISWGYGYTFQWTILNDNIVWNYPGHPNMDTPFRIDGDALYITVADGTFYRYIRD